EVGETGHEGARVEIVDLLLEEADHDHATVHAEEEFAVDIAHLTTPDICASTSKRMAKSFFARPMPRAAVSISLVAAVVGKGTSTWRPNSNANSISFCIILTSNQASSGIFSTNGPRY